MAPDTLFAYGTLLFTEILEALLGRVPDRNPAAAPGWRVAALPDRVYPGLVPAVGVANGLLMTDLTSEEWDTIDAFEDDVCDFYDLQQLNLADGRTCWTYVWTIQSSPRDWNSHHFAQAELPSYLERFRVLRQESE
ncbi:MAG: gamma-glutamylcyclotransferase family protein [Candidatus Dormibacteraceae bacterium]